MGICLRPLKLNYMSFMTLIIDFDELPFMEVYRSEAKEDDGARQISIGIKIFCSPW